MSIPLRVLIVEDSEDDALLLIRELRRGGYEPTFEQVDTPSSMNVALQQTWDIIIADYAMPHFSAPSALDMLKERGLDLPFVTVSGAIGEETAVAMMKAGAHDYIMKGNLARLIPAIEREMREAKVRQERMRAEEALQKSEERYRTLVECARDIIYTVSQDGTISSLNSAFETITGWSCNECIGKHLASIVHPDDLPLAVEMGQRVLNGERAPIHEVRIRSKSDEYITVEFTTTPLMQNGSIVGFLGVGRDVTERKKLEVQLQRARKMEAIGTISGAVAHDLNNILSGLVTYPDLLLMEIPEGSPLRKPILTIQKSGEKVTAIVQDLLTLARRGVVTAEVVNFNDIISDYLKSPEYERLKLYHPDVQVETNLEKDLLNILGSPVHLSKTVMNLVSNAAEAMPGGGKILISTETRYIDSPIRGYDYVDEDDYVTLTISDTGVGISPEDMERIFEPFYTKKVMGRSGTGLGMAVVWGTVKDHKGYIDIKSSEGKGTTFTLYFPVTTKGVAKDQSLVPIEDYMGKGESILVVDDVEEQREVASRVLKKLGYSVTSVSSGEEAVDYLKSNSADLLVLDMIMDPGIDGLETYKRILEFHPRQKALIVSGFSETERVKEAQILGAGAYLKKPFLLEKIGLAVRDELDK